MTTESQAITSQKKKKEKKSSKKKRKISKHMLQAKKDHADLEKARSTEALPIDENEVESAAQGALGKAPSKKPNKTPPGAPNSNTKDINEAAGYLTNWKNHRDHWKFNKNTQSWLIRHMYESDKVSKGTFALLLEYLKGLQGKGAKERILEDATRRALRYKQFEEGGTEDKKKEEASENEKTVQFSKDTKEAPEEDNGETKTKNHKLDPAATEDEKRWNELNDHDKRKEYKRARKVLETLKSD